MSIPIPTSDIEDWASPDHARWGLGTHLLQVPTTNMQRILGQFTPGIGLPIHLLTHPIYELNLRHWEKWRMVYNGGDLFVDEFLVKFSRREDNKDFNRRREMTPAATFASSAIDEIKNSIFQRIGDTTRTGGSETYQGAIQGNLGGVNLRGATMNWFVGHIILPELLIMQKVGVYVDAPDFGITRAEKGVKHPYFYSYRAEDIRSWAYTTNGSESEFSSLLLREYKYIFDPITNLPIREVACYRHVWLNPDTNFVNIQFYDHLGMMEGGIIEIKITKIPFVIFEITQSLMKNVANHQISIMNMESSDLSYILKSNYPLYTEQYDSKALNPYLKTAQSAYQEYYCPPGTATLDGVTGGITGTPPQTGEQMDAGSSMGRRYPIGTDRPGFIAPPSDPIKVSMEKQARLKDDIRALVHLALASIQSKAVSAESKMVDREQGLEAGLSSIGLELEHGERQLCAFWAMYEGNEIATVSYPEHWSLKSVEEILQEVKGLEDQRDSIPSLTFKREINKIIVERLLGSRVTPSLLDQIKDELDVSPGGSSNPKTINMDVEAGLVGGTTASKLRGYPDGEADRAQQDRASRLAMIAQAQSTGPALLTVAKTQATNEDKNLAARGVPDASVDPAIQASLEKSGKSGRGEAQ